MHLIIGDFIYEKHLIVFGQKVVEILLITKGMGLIQITIIVENGMIGL